MKKVFISLMLIIIMATNYTYDVHAEAATITVASGALATGGLSTAGFAGLLTPCAVIVGVGLLACGVDVALTNASQQAGMTKTDFIKSKIESFCNSTQKTVGEFCKTILQGASIAKNGAIELTDQASAQIKQFGEWLFSNDEVIEPVANPTNGSLTIDDYHFPYTNNAVIVNYNNVTFDIRPNKTVGFFYYGSPSRVYMISNEAFDGYLTMTASSGKVYTYDFNNVYQGNGYYVMNTKGNVIDKATNISENPDIPKISQPTTVSVTQWLDTLTGDFTTSTAGNPTADSFTGSRDDWASGSNALDPAQDKTTVLNPGLVQGLDIPGVNDLTTTVQDYLDALQEALDKANEIELPAIDTITGERVNVGVGEDTFDPAIDKEDNQDLPQDNTPVTDPSVPAVGDLPINQNTIDLKGVFPFCIPFDVVDMISMLSADPVAPRYTVNWPIPIINENLVFTVDLSPFNGVAEICRNMETILFCVGLALITRHLIRG